MIHNNRKHANYTFVKSHYTYPLVKHKVDVKCLHALQIFSSPSHEDMLMLIEYNMNKPLGHKAVPFKYMGMTTRYTEATVFLALCENIKANDSSLFLKLFGSASDSTKKLVLLQPFIYACCVKEFCTRSLMDRTMIVKQNEICKRIFCCPGFSIESCCIRLYKF